MIIYREVELLQAVQINGKSVPKGSKAYFHMWVMTPSGDETNSQHPEALIETEDGYLGYAYKHHFKFTKNPVQVFI